MRVQLLLLALCASESPAVPELFAPDVVSTDAYEFTVTFTPAMDEIYFTRREGSGTNQIFSARIENGEVRAPARASFSQVGGEFEPCITPDGARIYFGRGAKIVFCERTDSGWSDAEALPSQINGDFAMSMFADAAGDLYFTGPGQLMVVRSEGDSYSEAESLGPHFESKAGGSAHGFISPDESYIVFDSQGRSDGLGRADLYLSFRDGDNSWTEPQNIATLNTPGTDMCPSVSPDGRMLYFCRDGDIYQVDATVIEQYR